MAIMTVRRDSPVLEDGRLVERVRSGSNRAFEELYDRHARLVRAVCYDSTRSFDAAADLAQEVFLRAFRHLDRLDDPDHFGVWLLGIARQTCREWRRGRVRDERREIGLRLCLTDEDGPRDRAKRDRQERVLSAIASLPADEGLAVHLFYLQEIDAEHARRVMGGSRSGLYRLLASARLRLRRILMTQEELP